MPNPSLRTSPKKARKPQPRTLILWDAIAAITSEYDRMSIRQLYYQLVARGVIEKTEAAYKRVCDASAQMRFDGALPYRKIVDGNRERRIRASYADLNDALYQAHHFYRRDYWASQSTHVEVWCEKDALSGLINPVCQEYGIPYVAARGFSSITLRYETAEDIIASGKPAVIFYFGDHDASGQAAGALLEAEMERHGANAYIHRVALNPEQITRHHLPTRPGKASDSRHAKFSAEFGDECVELDALPPDVLIAMVRESVESMINPVEWERIAHIEAMERKTMASLANIDFIPGHIYTTDNDVA